MPTPPLPASVRLVEGEGGLPTVQVESAAASARIYLHGAHVTQWRPAGEEPVLWLSSTSRFDARSAIRGGVPICFPWFGPHAGDPQAPAHGFARVMPWELEDARERGDDVELRFRLADSTGGLSAAWPHRFEARYTVTVGRRLQLSLEVVNRDPGPITVTEALHTYLRVADVAEVELRGLEDTPYQDKVAGGADSPGHTGPLRLVAETDRVYRRTGTPVTVHDKGAGRVITVRKEGSGSTVVWNPWADRAATMSGLDDWRTMVCVEAANTGEAAVRLEPDEHHVLTTTLAVAHDRPASAPVPVTPSQR